jgi:hypothetical protein
MAELLDFDVVNVPTYDWGAGGQHGGQPLENAIVPRRFHSSS